MAKKDIYFDVRVSHRYINDGVISKKEYEDHIKQLPDVEENATALVLEDDIDESGNTEEEAKTETQE